MINWKMIVKKTENVYKIDVKIFYLAFFCLNSLIFNRMKVFGDFLFKEHNV